MGLSIGPFLRRGMTTQARGGKWLPERLANLIFAGVYLVGLRFYWDWSGWDRTSLRGAREFGQVNFELMVLYGFTDLKRVVGRVAAEIASERDRKSLDALLASRFSSLEIVLGAVATALLQYANSAVAMIPLVVLLVFLGVVDPLLALVMPEWLASTALLVAGISVAVSVGARTASNATFVAWGWVGAWIVVPMLYMVIRPIAWPGAPGWLNWIVTTVFDGTPIGVYANLKGLSNRPDGPFEAVGCLILASLALIAWSAARLRPASRALDDGWELGRTGRIKAGLRRVARRRPCGDDPMLWLEVHAGRRVGLLRRIAVRAVGLGLLAALGFLTWRIAQPAFRELAERGYGPSPEVSSIHWAELWNASSLEPAPGMARLWFNLTLRGVTLFVTLFTGIAIQSWPLECARADRKRDTWSGLLATPLTVREILKGKALGALWRAREGLLVLVALWAVGLASGSLHPVGFLASLATLAVLAIYSAINGLSVALLDCKNAQAGQATLPPPSGAALLRLLIIVLPLLLVGLLAAGVIFITLLFAVVIGPLLTYEDVAAVLQGGPLPEFGDLPIPSWIGARAVVLAWLIGIATFATLAWRVGRSVERKFDEMVGRPVRLPPGREADRIEALRRASTLG